MAKFLSVAQGFAGSDDEFLSLIREEVRHCDLLTLKRRTNHVEELVKIKFISVLSNLNAQLGLLDGI